MPSICIIAKTKESMKKLNWELARNGFACSITSSKEEIMEQITSLDPDLLLVEMDSISNIKEMTRQLRRSNDHPVIALADRDILSSDTCDLYVDDFVFPPYDIKELVLRIKRLIQRNGNNSNTELIKYGELIIDLARCEVFISKKPVILTFKEYELLKFLAANPGRVYSREALLNSVWGYDYYGGDRTVDVHIRRLRSKIEDSGHSFLETVRNIGYRFKKYI